MIVVHQSLSNCHAIVFKINGLHFEFDETVSAQPIARQRHYANSVAGWPGCVATDTQKRPFVTICGNYRYFMALHRWSRRNDSGLTAVCIE
jgi:hypothetical protein